MPILWRLLKPFLGVVALGQVRPVTREPGVGHVHEEGGEQAVLAPIALDQLVLEGVADAVQGLEGAVDAGVAELLGVDAQELWQGGAGEPALGV